jgi:hypothetical protein
MIKKCIKGDGSVQFEYKKEYPREMGEINNDSQKIFGTTIQFI